MKHFIILFILACFMSLGCAGGINPGQVPTLIIEDLETGEREGCTRMEELKVLRCEVNTNGKKIITDFPFEEVAPAPAPAPEPTNWQPFIRKFHLVGYS